MCQAVVMEEIYKYQVILQETTSDKWVRKPLIWHGIVVKTNELVDLDIFILNLLLVVSLLSLEVAKPKLAIVEVNEGKFCGSVILLDLPHFDVSLSLNTYLLMKL